MYHVFVEYLSNNAACNKGVFMFFFIFEAPSINQP